MERSTALLFLFVVAMASIAAQDYTGFPSDTGVRSTTTQQDTSGTIAIAEIENEPWIGISGTVGMVIANSFFLDHGDSTIAVGLTGEALREHEFVKGQNVIVYGKPDKDLIDRSVIKARAIAIEGVDGSEATVIGMEDQVKAIGRVDPQSSVVHGKVSAVTATRVIIGEGDDKITIDTSGITPDASQPGASQVKQGDLVTAQVTFNREFWNERILKANKIEAIDLNAGDEKAGTDVSPDER
ncbi:MAG: hypothetical protein M3R08_10165 [Bacteroidota bacterium]|nr:hypothetical protein [Bacteroidota bacterium]